MPSGEMPYQYCDGDETSMETEKCKAEVHLCLCGLFWRISSRSNKLVVSWHL